MSHYIDLHIHSRYSRATSSALNPQNLSLWAGYKGLGLIGTGDLTHPAWLKELGENLTRRDDGFYSLKADPGSATRFVPTGEVSAIYKQDGRTRKIHLVIIAPDLEASTKFSKTLGALGNVTSDGRPILGLSAKHILEIALGTHPEMMVLPAHIWTPWFSLFGAKSGFDHLEECFGDLSPHITALETGLSSDPAMNRLVSALDKYPLISSSDAHSPDKLGREATILKGDLTWANLSAALKGGPSLGGTVEFFPEEGKYHLDGHLGCGPALSPAETRASGGLCPVCGKPVTIGVLHRVSELADRESPPEGRLPDYHLIPLAELLGQVWGVGPKSRKVEESYKRLIGDFKNEMALLLEAPLADIEEAAGPLLKLGIERMRSGEVEAEGGFDGQFGIVRAISKEDRDIYGGQGRLFEMAPKTPKAKHPPILQKTEPLKIVSSDPGLGQSPIPAEPSLRTDAEHLGVQGLALLQGDLLLDSLDEDQRRAVTSRAHALAVLAGPGSGKTRVLVHRAAWLIRENLVKPEEMLLTTYTRKAAQELRPRLMAALPFRPESRGVRVATLHALAYEFMKQHKPDWELAPEDFLTDLLKKSAKKAGMKPAPLASLLSLAKNSPALRPGESDLPENAPEAFKAAFRYYSKSLATAKLWDFDDLLEAAPPTDAPFKAVLVDEFQDLSAAQFSFIKRLLPPVAADTGSFLTVIGDPDQSIYSFRGARPEIFDWLKIYPGLENIDLPLNYRSSKTIVQVSESLVPSAERPRRAARNENGPKVIRAALASPAREAAYVAGRVMAHLGVMKLGREATGRQDADFMPGLALNEIAILFRLRSQGEAVARALDEAGLPWQMAGEEPLTAADHLDFSADKISLLTMHASKGLEFRLIFVIGAEEGLTPYFRPDEPPTEARQAEEKRLFYVALTRAKDRLYLTRAKQRRLYGQALPGEASPHWQALPPALCLDVEPRVKTAKPKSLPTLFD